MSMNKVIVEYKHDGTGDWRPWGGKYASVVDARRIVENWLEKNPATVLAFRFYLLTPALEITAVPLEKEYCHPTHSITARKITDEG